MLIDFILWDLLLSGCNAAEEKFVILSVHYNSVVIELYWSGYCVCACQSDENLTDLIITTFGAVERCKYDNFANVLRH